MKVFIFIIFLLNNVYAEDFKDLLKDLDKHELVRSQLNKVKSLREKARSGGSLGDPRLSIAAINFPKDSMADDESMMTGYQFGLSQKLSISGKYNALEKAGEFGADSELAKTENLKRSFAKALWEVAIMQETLLSKRAILKDSLNWIISNLKVTKRLYSTGKVPQQAVLDIQIRKSELESLIKQNDYELESLRYQTSTLLSRKQPTKLSNKSIPWEELDQWDKDNKLVDYNEKALKLKLEASNMQLSAKNRNFVPDITLGVSYTKRNDIDGLGDFVGASISFPLPLSSEKYAAKNDAVFAKAHAQAQLKNYQIEKPNELNRIRLDILKLNSQLSILNKETLKFAKSSRDIIAKSYSRGGADYLELLRAELQYQKHLMTKVELVMNLKNKKVHYMFLNGNDLYAGELK